MASNDFMKLKTSGDVKAQFRHSEKESRKKQNSSTTKVVDEPQWVIRTDKDSPNKFKVAVGSKFLSSEVVPLNHTEKDLKLYRDRGYTLHEAASRLLHHSEFR